MIEGEKEYGLVLASTGREEGQVQVEVLEIDRLVRTVCAFRGVEWS